MTIEWYAAVVAIVGAGLWLSGSVLGSVISVLFFSLFSGGAAIEIGHATVQPMSLALVFLLAHVLLSMFRRTDNVNNALRQNIYLIFYCLYGAATAFILPKIFARRLDVPPMTGFKSALNIYIQYPLHFSPQNITTAIYLIGTMVAAIAATIASRDPTSRKQIVLWGAIISWVHVFFGVAAAIVTKIGATEVITFFRNATYAELTQTEGGLVRISGIMPEPSAYAAYAFGWFAFMIELWLRDVSPRLTMLTAAALGVMLVISTSTTAYASLAGYAVVMAARFALSPRSFRVAKAIPIVMLGLALSTALLAMLAFSPQLAHHLGQTLNGVTLRKASSLSGRQRIFWAEAGVKAFKTSWGLGIGAGSFRSSSLLAAILGCTGVVGFVAFVAHIVRIVQPLRQHTYDLPGAPSNAVAVAAAWAACIGLIPQVLESPSPDPSFVFAILGGLALGWRSQAARRLAPAPSRRVPPPARSAAAARPA